MNNIRTKKAWVDEEKKVISFHEIPGCKIYTAAETDFWPLVLTLMGRGFLVT